MPRKLNDCPHSDECPMPAEYMVTHGGPLDAKIVVVGQSPGAEEDAQGTPFIGPSGQELRNALRHVGFDPDEMLMVNAVCCHPPGNATPKKDQINLCHDHLVEIIGAHPRKLIIAAGNEAKCAILGGAASGVTSGGGQIYPSPHGDMLWVYHPAAVLRDKNIAGEWIAQLQHGIEYLSGTHPQVPEIEMQIIHPDHDEFITGEWVGEARRSPHIYVDIETTGLSRFSDALLGIGIGWKGAKGWRYAYVSLNHGPDATSPWREAGSAEQFARKTLEGLKVLLRIAQDDGKAVLQNAGFDVPWIRQHLKVNLSPIGGDTAIMLSHLDENRPKRLKDAARYWLKAPAWERDWQDEKGRTVEEYIKQKNLHLGMVPVDVVAKYCCLDCHYTRLIHELWVEKASPVQRALWERLQRPAESVLLEMSWNGMPLDEDGLRELGKRVDEKLNEAEKFINERSGLAGVVLPIHTQEQPDFGPAAQLIRERLTEAGHDPKRVEYLMERFNRAANEAPYHDAVEELLQGIGRLVSARMPKRKAPRTGVNPGSPDDMLYLLYAHLGLHPPDGKEHQTDGGAPSTGEATVRYLQEHSFAHKDILESILVHRAAKKLQGTYVNGPLGLATDGAVHPTFKQFSTVTGRTSCTGPNVQQVPKCLRPFYKAADGLLITEADFGQLEVRVLAHYSKDPALLEAVSSSDFHRVAAGIAYGKPPDEVTNDERQAGKVVVFGGWMYGGGASIVAAMAKISKPDAQAKLDAYNKAFPQAEAWLDYQIEFARKHGYVHSDFGRIRRLPNINHAEREIRSHQEREALNSVIQGTASDICVSALVRVSDRMRAEMMLSTPRNAVHDSIVIMGPATEGELVRNILTEEMTRPPYGSFTVPLTIEIDAHQRWNGEIDWEKIAEFIGSWEDMDAELGTDV